MDPASIAALAGGVILPVAGGIAGQALSAEDKAEAERQRQLALQQYLGLDAGSPDAVQAGATEFNHAAADPESVAAQRAALRKMQELAFGGGYSIEDRAAQAEAQQGINQNEASQRAGLMRDAQARGLGGSNLSMASQLQAQQGASDRLNKAGTAISAEGHRRALQALQNYGQMAGGMRGQSYQEAADRAGAQDSINKFNAQNQNQQRQQYNDNSFRNAEARAGGYGAMADARQRQAEQTQQMWSQMGQGAGKGASGTADYLIKKKDD